MPDTELLQMALVGYEAERQNIQAKIAELPAPTEWPRRSRRWSGGHYSHEARQKAHEYRCQGRGSRRRRRSDGRSIGRRGKPLDQNRTARASSVTSKRVGYHLASIQDTSLKQRGHTVTDFNPFIIQHRIPGFSPEHQQFAFFRTKNK
jgi:hypothetical protein